MLWGAEWCWRQRVPGGASRRFSFSGRRTWRRPAFLSRGSRAATVWDLASSGLRSWHAAGPGVSRRPVAGPGTPATAQRPGPSLRPGRDPAVARSERRPAATAGVGSAARTDRGLAGGSGPGRRIAAPSPRPRALLQAVRGRSSSARNAPSGYVSARTSSPSWTPSRRQRLIPRPSSPERGEDRPRMRGGVTGAGPAPRSSFCLRPLHDREITPGLPDSPQIAGHGWLKGHDRGMDARRRTRHG